jgi:peptidoglycan hydrolase CwlO-like protein
MRRSRVVAICVGILVLAGVAVSSARDAAAEAAALEQKAQRLQAQIDQAKSSQQANLNNQIQAHRNSVDVLVKQRVQIDAQITQLEGQIQEITAKAQDSLNRQVSGYADDLDKIKSQLSSVLSEKAGEQKAEPAVQRQP